MGNRMMKILVTLAVAGFVALGAGPAVAIAGFGDVPVDQYYAAPVQWMSDTGLSQGTTPGCFSPGQAASRAEVATFIHRANGSPAGGAEPFTDVGVNDYFADAVAWMVNQGITTGVTATSFEPYRNVTRGEIATFIHRSKGSPPGGSTPFTDVPAGAYYAQAVAWMVDQGITTGVTATTFEPNRNVTRAESAAFLYRSEGRPGVTITAGGDCSSASLDVQLDVAEAWSYRLLNQLRASVGRAPLIRSTVLDSPARAWSQTMNDTGDFKHSGLPYGENIAWWSAGWAGPEAAAQTLHDLWVGSPGHYANMTNAAYNSIGVGFWRSSSNGWYATHIFSS
ncbi:MAG: S-layer homology domain-containing protein [Acidimicrobiales bacterium]